MTFPSAWRPTTQHKTLAYMDRDSITTEQGEQISADSWGSVKGALSDGLLILTPRLVGSAWWPEALTDGVSVSTSERLGVTGVRAKLRDRRKAGWIIRSDTWGGRSVAQVRECLRVCEQGDHPTPSSVGLATMVGQFTQDAPRLHKPAPSIDRAIRAGLIGGRVDTVRAREDFARLYELDANSAFAAAAQRLPAGSPYAIYKRLALPGRTAYLQCLTRAPGATRRALEAPVGALPVRTVQAVSYPVEGQWRGWYWQEEIDVARAGGYRLEPEYGWEWPEWSCGLGEWAQSMHRLRADSELVKLVIVAAIGRFLGHTTAQEVTEEETDRPYMDGATGMLGPDGKPWPYYLREKQINRWELLPHIGSYIHAMVRIATYRKALEEREALVATNYDAVYTLRKPSETSQTTLGGWKWRELSNAHIPYPRAIVSDEKTRLPGVHAALGA